MSLNTFEEEMDWRESASEICVKRLGVTYMLNLSQQYNTAAKKANVILFCVDRTETRMRQVSGSAAFLSSTQIVHGVLCLVWCTTL